MTSLDIDDHLVKRLEALMYGGKSMNDVIRYLLNYCLHHTQRQNNINTVFDEYLVSRFAGFKPRNLTLDKFLHRLLDYYLSGGKDPIISSGKPWSIQYVSNYLKMQLDKEYEGNKDNFEKLILYLKRVEQNCECPARDIWNGGKPTWCLAPRMNSRQRARALELSREIYLKDVEPTHLLFSEPDPNQLLLDGFEGCKIEGKKTVKLASTMPRIFRRYLVFTFYLPSWQRLFGESITAFDVLHDGEKLSIEAKMGMKRW